MAVLTTFEGIIRETLTKQGFEFKRSVNGIDIWERHLFAGQLIEIVHLSKDLIEIPPDEDEEELAQQNAKAPTATDGLDQDAELAETTGKPLGEELGEELDRRNAEDEVAEKEKTKTEEAEKTDFLERMGIIQTEEQLKIMTNGDIRDLLKAEKIDAPRVANKTQLIALYMDAKAGK